MDHVNVSARFEARSFTRSWDNSDWRFALDWEEEAVGVGDSTVRKGVDEFL